MGVMGENILGFGVVVENTTGASVGNVCVGLLTGWMTGAAAARSPQAVVNTQTIKIRINTRFIKAKYIGRKLSSDEFLC